MAKKTERVNFRTDPLHIQKLEVIAKLAARDQTKIIEHLIDVAHQDAVRCGMAAPITAGAPGRPQPDIAMAAAG